MKLFCSRWSFKHYLWFLFIVVLLARLLSLGAYPLMDTTEARYAEMARKMLETGNWVTPLYDYGVPFWGKPPLSFWASAGTMWLFGVNEFAARLAPFLSTLLLIALFWAWPRADKASRDLSLGAAIVFLSSVAGFIAAGAVMTDMFMALATTLSMVAFWRAINEQTQPSEGYWRWLFFVGLGLGLLAKGPVATVLTLLPIGMWVFWQKAWRITWQRLPWLYGSLLTLAIAVPWYVMAEVRTPGFLHYFIIGEHWQRYIDSGWKGDLYGTGHAKPYGVIWLDDLAIALPWSLMVVLAILRKGMKAKRWLPTISAESAYLICWMVASLLFFTMARNILPVYALPGIPAFALFAAHLLLPHQPAQQNLTRNPSGRGLWNSGIWLTALLLPIFAVWVLTAHVDRVEQRSQRVLLHGNIEPSLPLIYLYKRPYSASFYSGGRALMVSKPDEILHWLSGRSPAVLVLPEQRLKDLPPESLKLWSIKARNSGYALLTIKR